jgi:hypothetical protein
MESGSLLALSFEGLPLFLTSKPAEKGILTYDRGA